MNVRSLKSRAFTTIRAGAERIGLQVVPKTYYSAIPALGELPPDVWNRRSELHGIHFDLDEQVAWIERNLGDAMREFAPPERPSGRPGEYALANDSYGRVGADLLHGVVRGLKPGRIVELGSGHSTLIMAAAAVRNGAEGVATELRSFDPFPATARPGLPGLAALERVRAQDVPLEVFQSLQRGDVLFVDTTHTVKLDSDVNRIVLDVLPLLAPGVLVHVHDVFLPYEYPREWPERYGFHWAEQYLLQAFLSGNPGFEVLAATFALCRDRPDAMARLAPTWRPGAEASAFWFRSRVPGDPAAPPPAPSPPRG
jgi:predicted O-methyltransferase YrrM